MTCLVCSSLCLSVFVQNYDPRTIHTLLPLRKVLVPLRMTLHVSRNSWKKAILQTRVASSRFFFFLHGTTIALKTSVKLHFSSVLNCYIIPKPLFNIFENIYYVHYWHSKLCFGCLAGLHVKPNLLWFDKMLTDARFRSCHSNIISETQLTGVKKRCFRTRITQNLLFCLQTESTMMKTLNK